MKVRVSPTSPKAKLQQQSDALTDLYTQSLHRIEPPHRRPRISYFTLLLAFVLGFCGGIVGQVVVPLYVANFSDFGISSGAATVSSRVSVKRSQQTAGASGETLLAVHKEVLALYAVQGLSGTIEDVQQLTTQVGSAILLTDDGWAVTTAATPETGSKNILVAVTNDRRVLGLNTIVRDPASDLIFFQIDGANYPAASFGAPPPSDSTAPFAVLAGNGQGTVARARSIFLDGKSQRGTSLLSSDHLTRLLQLSARLPVAYNGGPLVDQKGTVVGVVVTDGAQDAYAIPAADLQGTLREVLRTKTVRRPRLGVRYIDLGVTPGVPETARGGANVGARITGTKTDPATAVDSPARLAGLRDGDVIVAVGPEKLSEAQGLQELILTYQPGDSVELTILRDGKEQKVSVLLDELQT